MDLNSFGSMLSTQLSALALIPVIAYLGKHYLNSRLQHGLQGITEEAAKKLTAYKSELDKDRIKFESGLKVESTKHQIKYGGIFEKKAEAILELYRLLVKLEDAIDLVKLFPNDKGLYDKFIVSYQQSRTFYHLNEPLIPQLSIVAISEYLETGLHSIVALYIAEKRKNRKLPEEEYKKNAEALQKALNELGGLEDIKGELKMVFSKAIGTIEAS